MTDYSSWSLSKLKAAAAGSNPAIVQTSAKRFADGVKTMNQAQDDFMRTINSLKSAWQGKAAQAAITAAQESYRQMELTNMSSEQSQSTSQSYASSMNSDKKSAASIQNVDTSWGGAASSGGWAGPFGILAAKAVQQKRYDDHHDQAAKVVEKMDTDGQAQADTMNNMTWPTSSGTKSPPQRNLPPPPGSSGGGGSGPMVPGNGYAPTGGPGGGPGYTPIVAGPQGHGPYKAGNTGDGPKNSQPPQDDPSGPKGTQPQIPDMPTAPQTGSGLSPTDGTGSTPLAEPAPTVSGSGAGGAAAVGGVLGGAGLLGALGGRGLLAGGGAGAGGLAEGEGAGLRTGMRGGLAEGEEAGLRGGMPRDAGGLAEGEGAGLRGGLPRGAAGMAEGEQTGLRPGARSSTGLPAEEDLAARRIGPAGYAGEPVGEAGRGGYPFAPGGMRRSGNDDEEAPMPDYLLETDDVWGDGVSAAPPVIGE